MPEQPEKVWSSLTAHPSFAVWGAPRSVFDRTSYIQRRIAVHAEITRRERATSRPPYLGTLPAPPSGGAVEFPDTRRRCDAAATFNSLNSLGY